MIDSSWLWALFTVIAAASQTVRNATQRELTAALGTAGATHVRFLFGLPFALLFLAGVMIWTGNALPRPPAVFWAWVLDGALAQIAATALMLAAMNDRSFVVVYAYIKTEPVQAALFGLVFLGDAVTLPMAAAILIATAGRRCSRASWGRSPRSSGSSRLRLPRRRACARWRWSRCCSRRRSRFSCSSRPRRHVRGSG